MKRVLLNAMIKLTEPQVRILMALCEYEHAIFTKAQIKAR